MLALCETLIAGGDCLDDVALLRADSAQEMLRGHGLPDPTTLGRFLRRFTLGHLGQLNRALDRLFARVQPLLGRGDAVTLDLDASYVATHGPVGSRQGARGTYAGRASSVRASSPSARASRSPTRSGRRCSPPCGPGSPR